METIWHLITWLCPTMASASPLTIQLTLSIMAKKLSTMVEILSTMDQTRLCMAPKLSMALLGLTMDQLNTLILCIILNQYLRITI